MSIATEITRLQEAKTAIKTSIENKGVVVADNLTIDGYSTLIDDIDTDVTLQAKTITENGTFLPDSGYDGLSSVTVNVEPNLETLSVTSNGTYTSTDYDGYSTVTVNVESGGGSTQYDQLVFTNGNSGNFGIGTKYARWKDAAYSKDNTNWVSLTGSDGWTAITDSTYTNISYTSGETLYFRFTNRVVVNAYDESGIKTTSNTVVSGDLYNGSAYVYYRLFTNSAIVSAENLNFYSTVVGQYWGYYMFGDCRSLTTAPTILPATVLTEYCYSDMFQNCNSLTTAPNLPATTLAENCYSGMFSGCHSLTTAPELPATTLAGYCYSQMFYGCSSLATAPVLPATTLVSSCYYNMFAYCSSLTTAPELPATDLVNECYNSMFNGCTSLTTAPELPATTLADSCYNQMFQDCTSLTTAPVLPATDLTNGYWCYAYMFSGCSNLKYIKAMFTTEPTSDYTEGWVDGVASTGTFVKNSAATWDDVFDTYAIPSGWTVETADA